MKQYLMKALSMKVKLKISLKMVLLLYLTHGVEAFAPKRHLVKEDDSKVSIDEVLTFPCLEFQKDSQKIIVSHTIIFKEFKNEEAKKTKKNVAKVQKSQQKSTLGDMDELIALKQSIQNDTKKQV